MPANLELGRGPRKPLTWTHMDKSSWPNGPWQHEPDKLQWQDPTTNLVCLAVRNHMGVWCGYVGVPEGHPCFAMPYQEAPDFPVHGGLTFSGFCQEDEKEHGICHRPLPGEPDRVWWMGFDCGHGMDYMPGMWAARAPRLAPELKYWSRGHYWTVKQVKRQCRNLAVALKAMK